MAKHFLSIIVLFVSLFGYSQTIEQTAGTYYAYPESDNHIYTPAPDGYKPCYISHYGRHGSRWITDDVRYTRVVETFDSLHELHQLTVLGEDVRQRVHRAAEDALGRSGQLTPRGEQQHKGIAKRMFNNYKEVFDGNSRVEAVSSTTPRCIFSMHAFLESLKENNPKLSVSCRAYPRDMTYIAYTSPEGKSFSSDDADWRKEYNLWVDSITDPERLMSSLIIDSQSISRQDKQKHMMDLYWLASDMQNIDLDENFYDLFTYSELKNIWRTINARMYICNGCAPANNGIMAACASHLLNDIVMKADSALNGNSPISANLRFGHDTHLLRLLALMRLEGCANEQEDINAYHTSWTDYELSPMAANLQIIFYKKSAKEPVLVKFLLNEKEIELPLFSSSSPYYPWEEVKLFWK